MSERNDMIANKALEDVQKNLGFAQNEEEIAVYMQNMAAIAIQMLAGIKGDEFKKGFLKAAGDCKVKITPMRAH